MDKSEGKRFADHINGLREKQNISMKQLCEGLCSDRNAMYIMRGEREPDRLMREALLERLGVGAEDYECYLGCEEYAQWKLQQQIVHCIAYEKMERAEGLLETYYASYCVEGVPADNRGAISEKTAEDGKKSAFGKVARQFYLSMLVQIRRYRGCRQEEETALFQEALRLTVPAWEKKQISELVLSIKELNLFLEVERCRRGDSGLQISGGERPERYREILEAIGLRKLDRMGMAKIYPKTVYFLCSCLMEERTDGSGQEGLKKLSELMGYCNRALKILRDSGRMYYLWEILDMRERLFEKLEETGIGSGGTSGNREVFQQQYRKNAEWKQVLEKVYEEFRVPKETFDYCYLYVSKGISCTNEVIRIRSKMLGMKDEELCEGVCTTKTLKRIRKSQVSPQRYVVKGLFEKMGLSGELVRTELVTGIPEARELMERLRVCCNKNLWKEAEYLLKRVRELIPMDIVCNKQVIQRYEILIAKKKGEIGKAEYYRKSPLT